MLNKNENIHGPFLINVFQTCPSSASSTNEGLQWDAKLCLNSTHLCSLHPPEEPMCINDATTHGIQHNRTMEELRYRQQTELREAETKNKKRLEIAVSKLRKRDEERRKEREMIYEEVDQMD
ncbi:hypothetical protein Fcan01_24983 [Folsomia candida]|uniref:Uncharacterized protein n=1 Tax=Folsomia candida TaxID=158441 RepID=A0A226D6G7_FOLCA|nr:hypothetical protein Fcan01_24983 [Folsomia candida]